MNLGDVNQAPSANPPTSPASPSNLQQTPSQTINFQNYVGTLGTLDRFFNTFRSVSERKIEFSNQNQPIVIKIKELSQKTGISTAVIYEASKNKGSLESLIRLSEHLTSFGVPSRLITDLSKENINMMINLFELLKDSNLSKSVVSQIFTKFNIKSDLPLITELIKYLKNTPFDKETLTQSLLKNDLNTIKLFLTYINDTKLPESLINKILTNETADFGRRFTNIHNVATQFINAFGVSPSVIEEMYDQFKMGLRRTDLFREDLNILKIDRSLISKASKNEIDEMILLFKTLGKQGVPSTYINEALKNGIKPSLADYQAHRNKY